MDLLQITNYVRNLLARAAQSGWRVAFGWGGGAVLVLAYKFAFIEAPLAGIALSGEYYLGLNAAAGLFIGAFIARGVEKAHERAAGGRVNNVAIS